MVPAEQGFAPAAEQENLKLEHDESHQHIARVENGNDATAEMKDIPHNLEESRPTALESHPVDNKNAGTDEPIQSTNNDNNQNSNDYQEGDTDSDARVSEPPSLLTSHEDGQTPDSDSDSDLTDYEEEDSEFDFDYQNTGTGKVLIIKPTKEQWTQFPAILAFARSHGAEDDGCFKIVLPSDLTEPTRPKPTQTLQSNAYKAKQKWDRSGWQVSTCKVEGDFTREALSDCTAEPTPQESIKTLRSLFTKHAGRTLRHVRYRPDVPAWTAEQRQKAGVPLHSPIHPLQGDKLDQTQTRVPGIHTPYVYESSVHFGAMFQIHAEDYRLLSLNHLYAGRKIWIVTPCTAVDKVEAKLGRGEGCSQFMRHRAEFLFPQQLDKLGIEYRVVDQRPGETMVILPDAYHEGFSTGYTLAEAKNYADAEWDTDDYVPCDEGCNYAVAIPADHMKLMQDPNQQQVDLCAAYGEETKRAFDEVAADEQEGSAKRIRLDNE